MLRDDVYDEDKLRADQELLRRFYYNHGYADFQVVSAVGELDDTTNKYTVTITVQEGERYTFGDVSVESTIPEVDSKSLKSVVETRKGDVYNAKDVEDTIIALTEKVAGSGYAFAQVTPRGDRNFENHTISVVYTIDQGTKAYIERIEIRGNDRTRDYVIRREFDVSEGDAFNQVLIQRAKKRLEDLNYFDKVEISTVPGSQPDQVVLVVDVVEKSTGEFSVGAGYSTGGDTPARPSKDRSPSATSSAAASSSSFRQAAARIRATTACHSPSPISSDGASPPASTSSSQTRNYDHYDSDTTGATDPLRPADHQQHLDPAGVQYLAGEVQARRQLRYLRARRSDGTCNVSQAILDGIEESPWIKSSVSLGLVYNTIDDMKNPHEGIYANTTVEVAGLGGDAKFVKLTGRGSVYQTLSEQLDLVGLMSGGAGHIEGYGSEAICASSIISRAPIA